MDDELTPEQKFAAEDPETMVPRALMRGRNREEIIADLDRLDWSRDDAEALIERAMADLRKFYGSPETRRELVHDAKREVVAGLEVILLASLVAAFQILLLLSVGLLFVLIPIALLIVGMAIAGRGWTRWGLYGRDRLPFEEPVDEDNSSTQSHSG